MAVFPPPTLHLYVPEPLRDVFRRCEIEWGFHPRNRAYSLVPDEWPIRLGLGVGGERIGPALRQFEVLLDEIGGHRGPIDADAENGCFDDSWQSPHDCLTYFADWRRAIAEAVRGVEGATFFSTVWLTEPVVGLRDAILADRAFDHLPILADALEEAGCDNRVVLDHLRAGDDHSTCAGCWTC